MDQEPYGEQVICWVCDYGLFFLAVLLVVLVAWWRWQSLPAPAPEPAAATITVAAPTTRPVLATRTPPSAPAALPTQAPVPTQPDPPAPTEPPAPDYVLVFIPVEWQASQEQFAALARAQAETFIQESGIDQYFTTQAVILPDGPGRVSLNSNDLLDEIIAFGQVQHPGDRYIGLTDGDLVSGSEAAVVGWTMGPDSLGMVGEAADPYVTTHELAHTFGLCDEYSYSAWVSQNEEFPGGCPNAFPQSCAQDVSAAALCEGEPTQDGRNSIMGPAGRLGDYGFNAESLAHLSQIFQELVRR